MRLTPSNINEDWLSLNNGGGSLGWGEVRFFYGKGPTKTQVLSSDSIVSYNGNFKKWNLSITSGSKSLIGPGSGDLTFRASFCFSFPVIKNNS